MPDPTSKSTDVAKAPDVAFIGCWFNGDMYSHSCSNLVDSLRSQDVKINVVTSNCRCYSSSTKFDISVDQLINSNCSAVKIPHAPPNPGLKHGRFKQMVVKGLRLDIWLAAARGFLYYKKAGKSEVVHFDQVLEAFGCIPVYVLSFLTAFNKKRLFVTIHEIDPFQKEHPWINRFYKRVERVLVFSEDMKKQIEGLGVDPKKIFVTRYGAVIPPLSGRKRTRYIYFGGHHILSGKGIEPLIGALKILKAKGTRIDLLLYYGYGCVGMEKSRALAEQAGVNDMIEWSEYLGGTDLSVAYQASKACIVPYTSGSARHPLTNAMVNATPVIGTNKVDIPEYVGPYGITIDGSAESIANAIMDVENGAVDLEGLGRKLREKAIDELAMDRVAANVRELYAVAQ